MLRFIQGKMGPTESVQFKTINRIVNYKLILLPSGCWVKEGCNINNYQSGNFFGNKINLHIISAMLFHGLDVNKKEWALHKCDIKGCCNPSHIHVGYAQDNSRDARHRRINNSIKGEVVNRVETPNKEFELEFLPTNDHKVN